LTNLTSLWYCEKRFPIIQNATMRFQAQDAGRKTIAIMRILSTNQESLSIFMRLWPLVTP